jgi:nitrile hydratase alpha subunit
MMEDGFIGMGPHDVGGEEAGPIETTDHGMSHWEKHANAIRMTASEIGLCTLDELRRTCEALGSHYYEVGYFERQTESLAIMLVEKEIFSQQELDQRMAAVREKFDVPIIDLPHDHDHDGKPIQEDEAGEGPNEHHVMNLAIQELLQERGIITPEQIRLKIEKFDGDYPNRGPKVVARAWADPDFRARLLEDANSAVESMGIDLEHAPKIIALENTPEIHNVVVCTLCSCYPRQLMGQPPTWYKSRSYRSRVVYEPREVLKEFGTELPEEVSIQTHDSNADMRYIVIPMRPEGTDGWSEEQLEAIVSRDSLVGMAIPTA